jgi:hypothetical protein
MAALLSIDALRQHSVRLPVLAHDIPGRLRVVLPWLRDDPRTAAALCRTLRLMDGVIDVQTNPTAASVTVLYDARGAARAQVLDVLGQPQPAPSRSKGVADIVAGAVAKHLADAAMHALVAALM